MRVSIPLAKRIRKRD